MGDTNVNKISSTPHSLEDPSVKQNDETINHSGRNYLVIKNGNISTTSNIEEASSHAKINEYIEKHGISEKLKNLLSGNTEVKPHKYSGSFDPKGIKERISLFFHTLRKFIGIDSETQFNKKILKTTINLVNEIILTRKDLVIAQIKVNKEKASFKKGLKNALSGQTSNEEKLAELQTKYDDLRKQIAKDPEIRSLISYTAKLTETPAFKKLFEEEYGLAMRTIRDLRNAIIELGNIDTNLPPLPPLPTSFENSTPATLKEIEIEADDEVDEILEEPKAEPLLSSSKTSSTTTTETSIQVNAKTKEEENPIAKALENRRNLLLQSVGLTKEELVNLPDKLQAIKDKKQAIGNLKDSMVRMELEIAKANKSIKEIDAVSNQLETVARRNLLADKMELQTLELTLNNALDKLRPELLQEEAMLNSLIQEFSATYQELILQTENSKENPLELTPDENQVLYSVIQDTLVQDLFKEKISYNHTFNELLGNLTSFIDTLELSETEKTEVKQKIAQALKDYIPQISSDTFKVELLQSLKEKIAAGIKMHDPNRPYSSLVGSVGLALSRVSLSEFERYAQELREDLNQKLQNSGLNAVDKKFILDKFESGIKFNKADFFEDGALRLKKNEFRNGEWVKELKSDVNRVVNNFKWV